MSSFKFPLVSTILLTVLCAAASNGRAQTLKIATLAPEGSSWVQTLRAIDAEIREKTQGVVKLKIYPGGVQGDEKVVLRKMRIGQLQGGGFAGQGISKIFPDALALQMPFLFENYDEVDYVLEKMNDYFKEGYQNAGFVHLCWADIGFVHILSKSPIRNVEDLHNHKVWRLEEEPITDTLFRLAGVTSVPLTIPDVLLGLQTNLVDVIYASPAAAIVLQWFTRVNYITQLPINFTLGAFLIDAKAFSRLSPEHQDLLRQTAKREMRTLSQKARKENEVAIQVMVDNGLQLIEASSEDLETFYDLVAQTREEIVGKAFSNNVQQLIKEHLSDFRSQRDAKDL